MHTRTCPRTFTQIPTHVLVSTLFTRLSLFSKYMSICTTDSYTHSHSKDLVSTILTCLSLEDKQKDKAGIYNLNNLKI